MTADRTMDEESVDGMDASGGPAPDGEGQPGHAAQEGGGPTFEMPPDMPDNPIDQRRLIEAVIFASTDPVDTAAIVARLPSDVDVPQLLEQLAADYRDRGVQLVQSGDRWAFRTAPDLGRFLHMETTVARKLSRAAVETLAIIAYHQPVTRADIEDIRGVALSKGTLDTLLEAGWIRPRGRRRAPGRPMTWGTSESFLDHFGLQSLDDLPGVEELRQAGLLDNSPGMHALREQVDDGDADDRQGDLLDYADQDEGSGPDAGQAGDDGSSVSESGEGSDPDGPAANSGDGGRVVGDDILPQR